VRADLTPNPHTGPLSDARNVPGRVLKLHRGFILTKKGDIKPPNKFGDPPWSPGSVFRFFKSFFVKISKVVLGFRNFGSDF
jgi:hypothetical protein